MTYRTTEKQRNAALHDKAEKLAAHLNRDIAEIYLIAREMANPMAEWQGPQGYAEVVEKESRAEKLSRFTTAVSNLHTHLNEQYHWHRGESA